MPKAASKPIPEGFHTITPHVQVPRAAEFIDFLKRAFAATEIARMPGPDGRIMHAEVRVGDSILMLGDDFPEYRGGEPLAQGHLPVVLHLYVPDADKTFAAAVAAGAQVVMPLADQFWGDRYGHVKDPFGITWAVATHKEDLTEQEIEERAKAAFGGAAPCP